MNRKVLLLCLMVVAGVLWLVPSPALAVVTCQPTGVATDCNLLITINPDLSVTPTTPSATSTYDGSEDQLVGVLNHSTTTIAGLHLSGFDIFGFDGDGVCGGGFYSATQCGAAFGAGSGYAGPNTSFTTNGVSDGAVNFLGGLAPGGFLFFSLEEPASASGLTQIVVTPGPGRVPEPASLLLLGGGLFVIFLCRRWSASRRELTIS